MDNELGDGRIQQPGDRTFSLAAESKRGARRKTLVAGCAVAAVWLLAAGWTFFLTLPCVAVTLLTTWSVRRALLPPRR
jgi:hypothetical protein